MGSIPRIVSTPIKWASRKLLDRALLRFPGGDQHSPVACVYCPEMCRFSCPTAVVSGNDAVTPCNKNSLRYKEERWPGRTSPDGVLWPIYDCTGCGRCTVYCLHEVPVADQLFGARATHGWDRAAAAAASLTDSDDPVGDLASELGDEASARRRIEAFAARGGSALVQEPKSLFELRSRGLEAALDWEDLLSPSFEGLDRAARELGSGRWLLHESVWLSRRLGRFEEVAAWVRRLEGAGAGIVVPFQSGRDCIDAGGEGAYPLLFEDQARRMALDFWERDRHRADGILTMSTRAARHFERSLGGKVQVISARDLRERAGRPR